MPFNVEITTDVTGVEEAFSEIWDNVAELGKYELEVGLIGNPGHHGSLQELHRVGWIQELGSIADNIPPRPFFTHTKMYIAREIQHDMEKLMEAGISGRELLEELGKKYKQAMWDIIETWTEPPNSPLTIRLKGRNDPLVETGDMRDSVDYRVVPTGAALVT